MRKAPPQILSYKYHCLKLHRNIAYLNSNHLLPLPVIQINKFKKLSTSAPTNRKRAFLRCLGVPNKEQDTASAPGPPYRLKFPISGLGVNLPSTVVAGSTDTQRLTLQGRPKPLRLGTQPLRPPLGVTNETQARVHDCDCSLS